MVNPATSVAVNNDHVGINCRIGTSVGFIYGGGGARLKLSVFFPLQL